MQRNKNDRLLNFAIDEIHFFLPHRYVAGRTDWMGWKTTRLLADLNSDVEGSDEKAQHCQKQRSALS